MNLMPTPPPQGAYPSPHVTGGFNMNQMLEMFKMQYMMRFLNEGTAQQGRGGSMTLYTMFILMAYDHLAHMLPGFLTFLMAFATAKYAAYRGHSKEPKQQSLMDATNLPKPPAEKKPAACIQYERNADSKVASPIVDAVMYHVCNLPDVRSLRFNGIEMVPNFTDMLMIDNDVWFEILGGSQNTSQSFSNTFMSGTNGGKEPRVEPITYKLTTFDHDIQWLHRFVERSMEHYEQEKKNKLGNELYYFDHMVGQDTFSNPLPKQRVWFKKSKFSSNRTLKNVYMRQCDELAKRVEFFQRRRDWYDSKGIPHTLGIVMWGHPGCGKTSTIKAIANETKRHVFNIMLSEVKTKEALKDLFYNDTIYIYTGDKMETYHIPIHKRLYVIEDIDAMDSIVLKRTPEQLQKEEERRLKREAEMELLKQKQGADMFERMNAGNTQGTQDALDLATLLNVLDGVRETPGRIIILSTNYPERLDEALLRPGRFDMMIEYEKHTCHVLIDHIEKYYDVTLTEAQRKKLMEPALDKKWTPAEVSQVLFKYIYSLEDAIDCLVSEDPESYFRFSRVQPTEPTQKPSLERQGTSLDEMYELMEKEMEAQSESETQSEAENKAQGEAEDEEHKAFLEKKEQEAKEAQEHWDSLTPEEQHAMPPEEKFTLLLKLNKGIQPLNDLRSQPRPIHNSQFLKRIEVFGKIQTPEYQPQPMETETFLDTNQVSHIPITVPERMLPADMPPPPPMSDFLPLLKQFQETSAKFEDGFASGFDGFSVNAAYS